MLIYPMDIIHTNIQTLVQVLNNKSMLIYPYPNIHTLVLVLNYKSILIYPMNIVNTYNIYTNISTSANLQIYTNISIQKYKH